MARRSLTGSSTPCPTWRKVRPASGSATPTRPGACSGATQCSSLVDTHTTGTVTAPKRTRRYDSAAERAARGGLGREHMAANQRREVLVAQLRPRRTQGVAVAVGHRKRPGEPWGHYVVLLLVAAPERRGSEGRAGPSWVNLSASLAVRRPPPAGRVTTMS